MCSTLIKVLGVSLYFRYEERCSGNLSHDPTWEASTYVQCHIKQGNPTSVQEVHARCNYASNHLLFILSSLWCVLESLVIECLCVLPADKNVQSVHTVADFSPANGPLPLTCPLKCCVVCLWWIVFAAGWFCCLKSSLYGVYVAGVKLLVMLDGFSRVGFYNLKFIWYCQKKVWPDICIFYMSVILGVFSFVGTKFMVMLFEGFSRFWFGNLKFIWCCQKKAEMLVGGGNLLLWPEVWEVQLMEHVNPSVAYEVPMKESSGMEHSSAFLSAFPSQR